jgi:hypothetical protein
MLAPAALDELVEDDVVLVSLLQPAAMTATAIKATPAHTLRVLCMRRNLGKPG